MHHSRCGQVGLKKGWREQVVAPWKGGRCRREEVSTMEATARQQHLPHQHYDHRHCALQHVFDAD